jgi:hypothetical protein
MHNIQPSLQQHLAPATAAMLAQTLLQQTLTKQLTAGHMKWYKKSFMP